MRLKQVLAAVAATAGALAAAGPASATTPIGAAFSGSSTVPCGAGVFASPQYVVPARGHIITYLRGKNEGNAGQAWQPLVLRAVAGTPDLYVVSGQSSVFALDSSPGIQVFPLPTPLAVAPGDLIGFSTSTGVAGCTVSDPDHSVISSTDSGAPGVGSSFSTATTPTTSLNAQAVLDTSLEKAVSGSGTLSNGVGFSIAASPDGTGTLRYTPATGGGGFSGTIDCVAVSGNAATIVATARSGLRNETLVQDNGASGDKLINNRFDPAKQTATYNTVHGTCINPDTTRLATKQAIASGSITIG